MTNWTHDQLINRINFEGKQAKDDKGKLTLHKTLIDVERHLADTINDDVPPLPDDDPWESLLRRYEAARRWLDT